MAAKSSVHEGVDPNVLVSGDIIGFQIDALGLLCTPSDHEPIPEKEEQVSHLRISTTHKKASTADYRRCMFKIENDSGERSDIVFGSTIKISHHPTGLIVVASTSEDDGYKDSASKLKCVFLSTIDNILSDSLVHKWIIAPRYKLREEGDPVRHNDYVILRNAQHKQLFLTSFPIKRKPGFLAPSSFTFTDHMVGLDSATAVSSKPGLNVLLLRKVAHRAEIDSSGAAGSGVSGNNGKSKAAEGEDVSSSISSTVYSSDYIRVMHREYRGHLLVRTDDELELQSSVMPLGSTNRKRANPALDHHLGVFLRTFADQQPREQLDFPAAYSSQGVWQVLSAEAAPDSVAVHGKVKFGSAVRLRHLITGQYLSVRPLATADTVKLKQFSTFCIPKEVVHLDAQEGVDEAAAYRDRSRNVTSPAAASAVPAPSLVSAPSFGPSSAAAKGSTPATSTAEKTLSVTPAVPTLHLCAASVHAVELHSTDWTGKHRNSVHLTFCSGPGAWDFKSQRSAASGNFCSWDLDSTDPAAHFSVTEQQVRGERMKATVYREHVVSGRTIIGEGTVHLHSHIFQFERDETVDLSIPLTDPATGMPGGSLNLLLVVNPLLSKEESRLLAHNSKGSQNQPGLLGGLMGTLGVTAPALKRSGASDATSDDNSTAGTEDGDSANDDDNNKDHDLGDLMEGAVGLSAAEIAATNWVVATSSIPDKYTKFNVLVVDRKASVDDESVSYNERFVFEHAYTKQRLKLSNLLGMEGQSTWWEYKGDTPLVPDPFREGSIVDSEVCQFDRVDEAEIKDILFGSRFLQLARAATTALQLTPRSSQLYMPLFRHFHNSLLSLTLWTLGVSHSDSTLCAESTCNVDVKRHTKDSAAMRALAENMGTATEKMLAAGTERLAHGVQDGLALLGIDAELAGSGDAESYEDSSSSDDDDDLGDHDTDSEDGDDEVDGGWNNSVGLQMGLLSPGSKYQAVSAKEDSVSRKKSKAAKKKEEAAAVSALGSAAVVVPERQSSLAPWVGRKLPRTATGKGQKSSTPPDRDLPETPLLKYASSKLDEFMFKDLPVNEVLLRRQIILSDSMIVDQIVHFLNILFQLQRAVTLTHDERMQEQFPEVPPFLLACSSQINNVIRACVYKNEKIALKLISVQGSFLAMISQKIQGWDPPIEAILRQTCKDDDRETSYGCIDSMNSQNDSLAGSSMNKAVGGDVREAAGSTGGGGGGEEDNGDGGEAFNALAQEMFSIEPILMDAISASDVRQVVEQMHELHLQQDPSALKIISLLTLLCSSGRAKKYFQNLLINAIAIQDHEEYSLSGDFVQQLRPSSLQTNCMLFFTQFDRDQWQVKFNSPFSFPSQQSKNQEYLRDKLDREGNSLKKLFAHYNTDDNAVLDVQECFELLEDLGLGGPFLYKEIRFLESSTIWGFACWWCYRSSFYYPASSISQCQLSPIQAIQVMGEKMTPALMELEMRRTIVSEQAVSQALDYLDILNKRIPGLCLQYEEKSEREVDGLSIVEDYVRSLGMTADAADDEFGFIPVITTKGGNRASSDAGAGASGAASAATSPAKRGMGGAGAWASARSAAQARRGFGTGTSGQVAPRSEWLEFSAALDEEYCESSWFRLGLNLLAEICKDRNAYTQRIVGSILPAECLLAVLEADSVHYVEKSVICKLLSNIYVDHRLVFPTRFSPFNTDIVYLGYKEDILNPAITMGKLFNAQSRTRFEGSGAEDGSELRRRLFLLLGQKISAVQLVSRSRAKIGYFASLFGLFKLLVLKGFFQETEYGFVQSNKTPDDFVEGAASGPEAIKTEITLIDDKAFTIDSLQRMLVEKLNYIVLAQKCTVDFDEISAQDDVVANAKHDLLRGKLIEERGRSFMTRRRFRKKTKNEEGADVSRDAAAKRSKARKTFDKVRDNFAFFDVLFADRTMADVVRSVIDILTYIHDIQQMMRLAKCWNYVTNAKLAMTERAYCQDTLNLDTYVPRLQLEGYLSKVFDGFQCTEPVPRYVDAVMSTTLYNNHDLRRKAFELLDRQLSLLRDGQHMFDHLTLVAKGHKAFLYRLATVYEDQLMGYVAQIVSQPDPTNAYLLERLTFSVENLRALHFSTFLDRLDAVQSEEARRAQLRRTATVLKKEAAKLNIDARSFVPDGKPEQDCLTYLMKPIPCPTGIDDFFELDLERAIMQDGGVEEICTHFELYHQQVEISLPEAVINCDITMARLGASLINVMLQVTRAPLFFPWHALYESEKFLLDQLLSFLAEVGYNSQMLIDDWYPQISELLLTYFPESIGCGKMVISILRRCRAAHVGKDTFSKQILRTIVHHGLVGTSMCSSVLTSILQSDETVAVNFAASFLLSRIQEFTCTFNFFTQPEVMQSNDSMRHHLHSILLPLSMCFSGKMEIPESILAVLRVPLSRDFCYSYLSSSVVPMFLKTSLIKIAVWLYPSQLVPVESLVLTEIRLMRKAFSLDVNIDLEKCMGFCRDFLFQGVALALRKRIVDSRFLTLTEINAEVTSLITDIESNHIHNISVAKIVGAKLKEYFTVAAPPASSKTGRGPTPEPTAAREQERDSDEEDGFVGSSGAGTSLMDLSVFQCVMVTLNVLRLKHGFMSKMLTAPQRADLIFLCCASRMIMSRYPERIVNPLVGEGLRTADFEHMIERLGEITHGMIKEYLARAVEKHIGSYYETKLVAAARKQFKECSQGSVEKAAQQAVSVFDLQRCFTDHALAEEKARFQGSMKLAVVFPVEYLIRTPFYRFLRDCLESAAAFMDLGGDLLFGDWRTPVVKSKTFANKFSHFTDFELWLRGDGRYLQCLLQYLSRVRSPTDAEYNLLHLLTALLLHNIEEIRQSKVLSLNYRLALVETETQRLRRLQLALNSLGAQSLLTVVLGNIYSCTLEPYIWLYAPLVLTFVNEVISWGNRESQQSIMDCIAYNIQKHKPPEMNCLLGLRMMVRKCNLEIAYCSPEGDPSAAGDSGPARLKGAYPDSEHTKILRSVKQLFTFVGMFCKGDNVFAQRFFSAHMSSSKQYVDLVLELCLLTNSILTKFTSMIVYMKNEAFYERLGPLVWESKDASKRRYLAWHSTSNNILLFTQYMFTIIPMLDGLLSMCCEETTGAVQQALNKCPDVLEFAGLMQLDAVSKIQTRALAGLSTGKHVVHWQGGNPFHFYRTYAASLNAAELAEGDPENEMIVTTLKRWSELKKPTYLGGASFNMCDFLRIFGVSHEFFEETARRMEEKCLAMVLAYFEVAESHQSYEMALHFHDGLLMQNMNCTFQKIFSGGISANDKFASSAVAYTSLVETIGDYFPETQELLNEWEEQSLQQGKDPKKIYGVVEIVGKHNRLQRLYFPVPTFVSRFWPYPEVQKMKDTIVLQVNRQSPEEKLADFLQQMVRITTVMKRQERLRGWLTFPVHAFFGGKTTSSFDYLPNQRMLALLLTLALNIYYCYFTSLGERFNPHDGSYLNRWTNWNFQDRALMIIKAVHLGLNASQTLSRLLNSEVTDELFQSYRSDSAVMDVLLKLAVSPLVVFYLIQDTFWPLCMLAFSFLAFYDNKFWLYVPCLFDVAFQLTFMNFLYSAVALNGSKIWYTLVLAFLCLYFYSVIATLYFNDQYTLDNHSGCSNIVACFKLHLDYGLYNVPSWDNDGYISPTLPLFFVYGTLVSRVLGTMYNVSYVILINLVLQSIISGLIIDTFSKLREENESVLQDINDKCFVCSISRDELEQAGIPFKQHILEEHNMWHYVWFKIYLESKDPLTYSSSENHSAEKMKDTQSFLKLMPIKKSVSLNQKGEQLEADVKLEDKLDALLLSMQRMSSTQNKLGKSVTLLRRANARIEQKVNAKQIQSPTATLASPPAV